MPQPPAAADCAPWQCACAHRTVAGVRTGQLSVFAIWSVLSICGGNLFAQAGVRMLLDSLMHCRMKLTAADWHVAGAQKGQISCARLRAQSGTHESPELISTPPLIRGSRPDESLLAAWLGFNGKVFWRCRPLRTGDPLCRCRHASSLHALYFTWSGHGVCKARAAAAGRRGQWTGALAMKATAHWRPALQAQICFRA